MLPSASTVTQKREAQITLIFGQLREGKEQKFLSRLSEILAKQGVKPQCLHISNGNFLLALPIEREDLIDYIANELSDCVKELKKLRLPETFIIAVDLHSIVAALDDIAQCVGNELLIPLVFRLGYMYGREICQRMTFRLDNLSDKLSSVLEYLRVLGLYKRWSILHLSMNRVEIAIEGLVERHLPHLLRGVIAGIVSAIFNRYYTCTLKSMRGNIMVFEVSPYS